MDTVGAKQLTEKETHHEAGSKRIRSHGTKVELKESSHRPLEVTSTTE